MIPKNIRVYDIEGTKVKNGREFCSMKMKMVGVNSLESLAEPQKKQLFDQPGSFIEKAGVADGIRADVDGNIWVGAGWVGEGYDGVHIFAPDGVRIGQIRLPEICANICFGGPKRNRLFMAASQSLYAVYLETRGGHFA